MAEEFLPLNPAERDNETAWYTATAAGIASGILKIPEGVFSLGAELIDLGADTNAAADVEKFFDKINPFEEVAEERAIGKLTEALVQIGVPGTIGFKMANKAARNLTAKALKAKRSGAYANLKGEKLMQALGKVRDLNQKSKYPRFAAAVMGGAAGEAFVADIEDIGTFGDMFESGPTQLDRDESTGREDATRSLLNRLKFGSESLLLTPFVFGAGKSAKLLANKGKDLAYSNSSFARWLDKYVRAPFSPRGSLTDELFESEKAKEALIGKDRNRAKEIVDNITREVDRIFPDMKSMFDKSTAKEKDAFMKGLNSILFEGDLRKSLDPKKLNDLIEKMKLSNVGEESRQTIIGALNNSREEFVKLLDMVQVNTEGVKLKKGVKELQDILGDRITNWVGTTYKIFEGRGKGIFKLFDRYTPTDEAKQNAIRFFREEIAKQNGDVAFNPDSNKYIMQATNQVNDLLTQVGKRNQPKPLDLNKYINKTMEGKPGGETIKAIIDETNAPPKVIRELLGEIQDPRYSIFNAVTNLSSVARMTNYISDVATKNAQVQARGGRGFFWDNEDIAKQAVNQLETGIELVKVNDVIGAIPGTRSIITPFTNETVTTREIAEAIKNANGVASGLQGFVRGEGKEGAEAAASWFYRNLLLFPKGVSQLAKTVFSIPTHLRNMFSAIGFSGANGILFENPALVAKAFRDGLKISGLTKLRPSMKPAELQEAYRELLELGVVNQQVQIGDLKALLQDVRFGEQAYNTDSILKPFMARMRGLKDWFQGKYVAEDDTFKITNYMVELERLKKQALRKNLDIADPAVEKLLKQNAANIVKNTVPNYAFVGSAVRTARLLPIGNFMSFPSEMIRTTTNIAEQGIKEMRHIPAAGTRIKGSNIGYLVTEVLEDGTERQVKNNALTDGRWGVGFKRLLGMATFTTGAPIALTEGAKSLYGVTQDELDALRRFVPEWSQNSTLIPLRDDDGELRYIDFSHSNAYDVVARPFRTLLNNIQDGEMTDEVLLNSFMDGIVEASSEIMDPFISESIWTEAATNILVRGGRTPDGRQLYTDQTPAGDRASIIMRHLGEALAPSYKQYVRLGQALTETPTKRGEELDIGPELGGLMGLRPIKVDPLRSMGFKIANYQEGIRNARREFTGGYFGLLKGGPIKPEDIIKRYVASNGARFGVQQNMFGDLNAAETLGVSNLDLNRAFSERQISDTDFYNLKTGKFVPYLPSRDIEERFREIARDLGEPDAYAEVAPIIRAIASEMSQIGLDENFNIDISEYITEIQTPPLPTSVTSAVPNPQVITQGQNLAAGNLQANQQTGLTPLEEVLLTEEEKLIRQRQRGITT